MRNAVRVFTLLDLPRARTRCRFVDGAVKPRLDQAHQHVLQATVCILLIAFALYLSVTLAQHALQVRQGYTQTHTSESRKPDHLIQERGAHTAH